jgi:hypothetical protein
VASDHNLVAHYKALSVFVAIIQSSARWIFGKKFIQCL